MERQLDDIRPEWWHPDWIAYAEVDGIVLIAHWFNHPTPSNDKAGYYNICQISAEESHADPVANHRDYRKLRHAQHMTKDEALSLFSTWAEELRLSQTSSLLDTD